jgi:hypothetical protein
MTVTSPQRARSAPPDLRRPAWELRMGIYLIVKGFQPAPILTPDGRRSSR